MSNLFFENFQVFCSKHAHETCRSLAIYTLFNVNERVTFTRKDKELIWVMNWQRWWSMRVQFFFSSDVLQEMTFNTFMIKISDGILQSKLDVGSCFNMFLEQGCFSFSDHDVISNLSLPIAGIRYCAIGNKELFPLWIKNSELWCYCALYFSHRLR